ncbi:MAG: FAD-dependent oxidoreductase [Chlamydiota bacterium]
MKAVFFSFFIGLISFTNASVKEEVYPVVILGGGIGALTSAIYLGRAGITPLVVEGQKRGGAIFQSPHVQNWPGEIEISGPDLIDKIHAQAEYNGARILIEEAMSVDLQQYPFMIIIRDPFTPGQTRKIFTNSCIIAMGSNPNLLGIPGEDFYWTRGVYNCAVCDGSLYKNQIVAVVGGGDAAILEAEHLANIAQKVYILVRKDKFRALEEKRLQALIKRTNVEVLFNTTVQEVQGDGQKVTHLILDQANKKSSLNVAALFLAIGAKPNSEIFQGQLEMDEQGYILLKHDQETSIKGVFAVGDIVDPVYKQAVIAAGQGAIAACQVVQKIGAPVNIASSLAPVLAPQPPASAKALSPPLSTALSGSVVEIASLEQFKNEVNLGTTPLFLDFYATWCGPCKTLSPMVDKWAKEYAGKVRFFKINVDTQEEIVHLFNIRSMPTVVILNKNGKEVARKIGTQEIVQMVKKNDLSKVK